MVGTGARPGSWAGLSAYEPCAVCAQESRVGAQGLVGLKAMLHSKGWASLALPGRSRKGGADWGL
eukprot:14541803-Alexandrium_andersonii.AAC.1